MSKNFRDNEKKEQSDSDKAREEEILHKIQYGELAEDELYPLLLEAAEKGYVDVADYYMEHPLLHDILPKQQTYAFFVTAIKFGHIPFMVKLLEKGFKLDTVLAELALKNAINSNQGLAVSIIINYCKLNNIKINLNVEAEFPPALETEIIINRAKRNNVDINREATSEIQAYKEKHPNALPPKRITAFEYACFTNDEKIIHALIEAGLDFKKIKFYTFNSIEYLVGGIARLNSDVNMLELMLKNGLDVFTRDINDQILLDEIAIGCWRSPKVAEILLLYAKTLRKNEEILVGTVFRIIIMINEPKHMAKVLDQILQKLDKEFIQRNWQHIFLTVDIVGFYLSEDIRMKERLITIGNLLVNYGIDREHINQYINLHETEEKPPTSNSRKNRLFKRKITSSILREDKDFFVEKLKIHNYTNKELNKAFKTLMHENNIALKEKEHYPLTFLVAAGAIPPKPKNSKDIIHIYRANCMALLIDFKKTVNIPKNIIFGKEKFIIAELINEIQFNSVNTVKKMLKLGVRFKGEQGIYILKKLIKYAKNYQNDSIVSMLRKQLHFEKKVFVALQEFDAHKKDEKNKNEWISLQRNLRPKLLQAISENDVPEIIKLVSKGADINYGGDAEFPWVTSEHLTLPLGNYDILGISPLHFACQIQANPKIFKILFALGADVNKAQEFAKNRFGHTVIELLPKVGTENETIIQLLRKEEMRQMEAEFRKMKQGKEKHGERKLEKEEANKDKVEKDEVEKRRKVDALLPGFKDFQKKANKNGHTPKDRDKPGDTLKI